MKFVLSFSCLFAIGVSALEVTPTAKVVTLLQGMLDHGKAAKRAEQVVYANKEQFCEDTSSATTSEIADEEKTIGTLNAAIGKSANDAYQLRKEINALEKDEYVWTSDIKAAENVRLIEFTDYQTTHGDYTKGIDALARAVAALKAQTHDRLQQASFAQLSAVQELSLIPDSAKRAIDAFVQTGGEEVADTIAAPEANGYEFQANGVIDMLEKLQSKFIDERTLLEKEEANAKHALALLKEDLTGEISQAETTSSRKSAAKGNTLHSKAIKTSDLKDVSAVETVDVKFLKDLKADCALNAADFAARQQLRSEELVAVAKAIEILSGDAVTGNAVKHLPSLLQTKKTSSFSQLRFTANSQVQNRVVQFLNQRAKEFNSAVLAAVAERASADPFSKVKKMIKDLVVRLMEEANEESDHKGWCDTEMATNKQTREEKSANVLTLNADIEGLDASILKLTQEIDALTAANSVISAGMVNTTAIRTADKATNAATVTDSQDAQTALAQALTVLKEFYAKAAEATSFAQTSAPYTGMNGENGGVVGMLEVIASDFARLESDTKAAEATSQREYDTFMTDSKTNKASKDTAIEHKTAKRTDANGELAEKKTDLQGTQTSLDAALTYYDKLKPSCVDSGSTYEDRVARRKEEVESLQEALKVMNGEDIADV